MIELAAEGSGGSLVEESSRRSPPTRLLICADWFAPGVRAGGPIRSVVNLSRLLGKGSNVEVLTSACDLGVSESYEGVTLDQWIQWAPGISVFYATKSQRLSQLRTLLRSQRPDALYLNSMFSFAGTLWPLLLIWFMKYRPRTVLAPRGMLKPSALKQKAWKKLPLLWLIRSLKLHRRIVFHATSADELAEIERQFPGANCELIANVPTMPVDHLAVRSGFQSPLQLCFVGRVHPIKNLGPLLEWMQQLTVPCALKVIGPEEDQEYSVHCREVAARLPDHVRVTFEGTWTESRLSSELATFDALVLPTQGENFGHAIFEALASGVPVIISDTTIWRELHTRHAGWDLSLDEPASFVAAIEELARMSDTAREQLRHGALRLAQEFVAGQNFESDYSDLFFGRR